MPKELATPVRVFNWPFVRQTCDSEWTVDCEYHSSLHICPLFIVPIAQLKMQAMERYRLGRTDFEAILPVHVFHNPRGGPYDIMKYNERDVRDLADRLHTREGLSNPSSSVSSAEGSAYATRKAEQITKTNSRNRFGLTTSQLERIKPVSRTPNKYNGLTWLYNVCDVEALAEQAGNFTRASRT